MRMTDDAWAYVLTNFNTSASVAHAQNVDVTYHRDMQPKTAYFAMDDLVNREWKTSLSVTAKDGKVAWDWWNCFDNQGPKGCNTKTYERFIDFAAKTGERLALRLAPGGGFVIRFFR